MKYIISRSKYEKIINLLTAVFLFVTMGYSAGNFMHTDYLVNDISASSQLQGYNKAPVKFSKKKQMIMSKVDSLGRARDAHIQLKYSQKPNSTREGKLNYNPVGWHNYKFNYQQGSQIKQAWLMNRGHLVGYQFSGLNDEKRNLVPMTAYLNQGSYAKMNSSNKNAMLYYENKLSNWMKNNKSSYLDYQVTPLYKGNELIPRQIRLCYMGYTSTGKKITIKLNSSLEKKGQGGSTCVTLNNTSTNATINYQTGTAKNNISNNATKAPSDFKIFKYHGATLANTKYNTYTVKVTKSNGKVIGYAKPNQTVYVASNGTAKVYWFDKSHMPKNTNMKKVKNYTIQNAVKQNKSLSATE